VFLGDQVEGRRELSLNATVTRTIADFEYARRTWSTRSACRTPPVDAINRDWPPS